MKRLKNYFKKLPFNKKVNTAVIIFFAIIFLLVGMCSCTVQESLLDHNPKDYKVIAYKYPYATVEVVKDSVKVLEYRYSLEPLKVGSYGISNYR